MASKRKYKCPYCNKSYDRQKLATHIDKEHIDLLNEDKGFTANRIVFDLCNKKDPIGAGYGICRICKSPTKWNEKNMRYEAFCSDACKKKARELYKGNMLKVYGKTTLLNDSDWQKKMLANRSISGTYKWSDGTSKSYVGSYEKRFLEFCDTILHLDSGDLITPGPTIQYEYNGEKHDWITDAIYVPYNLVFDIKDGGDNKNNRDMQSYRNKQIEKEKVITDKGEYNYIRLTNNDFLQLLTMFAELKEMYIDTDAPDHTISRIHEHMSPAGPGGMPVGIQPGVFIINYDNDTTFDKDFVISNDILSKYVIARNKETGKLEQIDSDTIFTDNCKCEVYKYNGEAVSVLKELYDTYKQDIPVDRNYLIKLVTEFDDILSDDQLQFSKQLDMIDFDRINEMKRTESDTLYNQAEQILNGVDYKFSILDPILYEYVNQLTKQYDNVSVYQDIHGQYYAYNEITGLQCHKVNSIYDITSTMLDTICI